MTSTTPLFPGSPASVLYETLPGTSGSRECFKRVRSAGSTALFHDDPFRARILLHVAIYGIAATSNRTCRLAVWPSRERASIVNK